MQAPLSFFQSAFGKRRGFLLCLLLLLFFCVRAANVTWSDFKPNAYGLKLAKEFLETAFQPALDYQTESMPDSAPPYWQKILQAVWLTLKYATCGISLALPLGIVGGFLGSRSWWNVAALPRCLFLFFKILHRIVRLIITAGRSIHELLWGLLFISAIGLSPLAMIVAIAIPYGSTLAKVFSEMLDEQSPRCKMQLHQQGGSALASWFFGTLVLALPDLLSYFLYRYECAIRSAAIFGFVGIPTIGYHIETAMADHFINEVWTLLYALLALILCVEMLSQWIRKKMTSPAVNASCSPDADLTTLKAAQKKRWGLFFGLGMAASLIFFAWTHSFWLKDVELLGSEPLISEMTTERRLANIERFLTKELMPEPVRESGNWKDALPWAKELIVEKGIEAALQTFYIATSAIILAWFFALFFLPLSSKALNAARPYGLFFGKSRVPVILRWLVSKASQCLFIFSRSMPEYLLAYLLLKIFGPTALPLILGLALHNFGIIGRLTGELIDNRKNSETRLQLTAGSGRLQCFLFSILPEQFNRCVLYFFYRWETCIRDSTVLGMLGLASIGFLVTDSQARDRYDSMLLFMLLGSSIVMLGDFLSDWVRSKLKQQSQPAS